MCLDMLDHEWCANSKLAYDPTVQQIRDVLRGGSRVEVIFEETPSIEK